MLDDNVLSTTFRHEKISGKRLEKTS